MLLISLNKLTPQGVLTLEIINDIMFNEESRRKEQIMFIKSKALVTEYHGRNIYKKFNTIDK